MVVLLVPTMIWVRLRVPGPSRLVEFLCLLPLTIPALVIVVGIANVYAWVTYFLGDSALTLTSSTCPGPALLLPRDRLGAVGPRRDHARRGRPLAGRRVDHGHRPRDRARTSGPGSSRPRSSRSRSCWASTSSPRCSTTTRCPWWSPDRQERRARVGRGRPRLAPRSPPCCCGLSCSPGVVSPPEASRCPPTCPTRATRTDGATAGLAVELTGPAPLLRRRPRPRRARPAPGPRRAGRPARARRAAARPPRCGSSPASSSRTAGTVLVGGKDMTRVPANKRDMGMVFQAYSLFPHLTVARQRRLRAQAAGQVALRAPRAGRGDARPGRPRHRRRTATPTSSPAASSSGSRSPGRWRSSRRCSCSTSRCRPSTRRSACSCATRSAGSSSRSARPRSSSPTTRRRRSRSPTGSAS